MKKGLLLATVVLFILMGAVVSDALAGWLIYHKPAFRGKVIDAETKATIEGAVVVAIYEKMNVGGPSGNYETVVHVKEKLTDKNGEFNFPAYTTIIQPLSWEWETEIIIYKPGYGNFTRSKILYGREGSRAAYSIRSEEFFSTKLFGTEKEVKVGPDMMKFTYGLVELPPLTDPEKMLRATPSTPSGMTSKDLPLFFKAINELRTRLGLKPVG